MQAMMQAWFRLLEDWGESALAINRRMRTARFWLRAGHWGLAALGFMSPIWMLFVTDRVMLAFFVAPPLLLLGSYLCFSLERRIDE